MKNKISKICLSFFIPFTILILFYFMNGIGTENTFLMSDLQGQYIALFSYLRGFSLSDCFYLLNKGLGGGMFGTFTYYLSSPLNLIIYLFPKDNLFLAVITLITLKISLSGLTMYTYLKYKYKTDSWKLLLFSTCYALMSYNINYYFNIMWLDGVMILPIVMLGIERILNKRSSIVYIISLTYAIISNYYIGYMICIASVLYFIFELFYQYKWKTDKKEMFKIFIRYTLSSLLSGFMCMILLIPTLIELQSGYKADSFGIGNIGFHFNFLDVWSRSYIGSHNYQNVLSKQTINIYCGLIILPLLYFFFVNKEIDKRKKLIYGIFLIVLSLGVYFDAFSMIWHAFNNANCFNYRYSFIIMFIMIAVATHSFIKVKTIDTKHYLIFLISYLALALVMMFKEYKYITYINIYISIGCILVYLFLIYNYSRYTKGKDIKVLLFLVVFAELFCNIFMSLRDYENQSIKEYNFYYNKIGSEIRKLQNDTYEYRMEKNFSYTSNDGIWIGYNGITNFLSTTNGSFLAFAQKAGYDSRLLINDSGQNSYIMDAILGVKYRIGGDNLDLYNTVNKVEQPMFKGNLFHSTGVRNVNVYENPYALSIGYMISSKNQKTEEKEQVSNAFEYHNYILNTMLGNNTKYFKPYSKEKLGEAYYRFTIDNDELVYIFVPFVPIDNGDAEVKVNGKYYDYVSQITRYQKNLNGEELEVVLNGKVSSYEEIEAYYFDEKSFVNDIQKLQENAMKFEILTNGYIKGSVVATKEMPILFLSIPLDEGWTLYVDGKETEIELLYDTFMGVSLEEGEHEIELKYSVPGLKVGIVISVISLTLTVIYLCFEKKARRRSNNA